MRISLWLLVGAVISSSVGCAARSDEFYARDVKVMLETRGDTVAQCYGSVLQANPSAAGIVAVKFRVMEDSGDVTEPVVDPAQTTAPPELQQCVLKSLEGAKLVPGDNRPANALYTWQFDVPAGGGEPPPEAAPAQ